MELSFGQRIDPENGLCELWLTHGALDWIKKQDWSDKNVLMFGGGRGDLWLAKRCKKLVIVERNPEWIPQTMEAAIDLQVIAGVRLQYLYRPCNDSDGKAWEYLCPPEDIIFDVVINDDAYRTECCDIYTSYFIHHKKDGIFICDNYNQSYVWRSPKALEMLAPFEKLIFEQPDHEDYNKEEEPDGKWKTAVIFIK